MSQKIFVGSLSFEVNDNDLKSAFEKFGEIKESKVITDRYTSRSRGFGFITFAQDSDAQKAIAEMDGKTINDRAIHVSMAKEPVNR